MVRSVWDRNQSIEWDFPMPRATLIGHRLMTLTPEPGCIRRWRWPSCDEGWKATYCNQ